MAASGSNCNPKRAPASLLYDGTRSTLYQAPATRLPATPSPAQQGRASSSQRDLGPFRRHVPSVARSKKRSHGSNGIRTSPARRRERRRAAGVRGEDLAPGRREPARRHRALLGRRPWGAAAGRDLLRHSASRDRADGDRNLVWPGPELDLRTLAARRREDRGTAWRRTTPAGSSRPRAPETPTLIPTRRPRPGHHLGPLVEAQAAGARRRRRVDPGKHQKVNVDGAKATELPTALGTLLSFSVAESITCWPAP